MSIKLYVEGGGDSKALRTECRRGFSAFLRKAGLAGRMPRIVACGGRNNAFESFETAHAQAANDARPLLLVDAEGPVGAPADEATPWEHLNARDGWVRPGGTGDEQCHLMVQCMEAWFLADREALASHFGQGFREGALPGNRQVEQIPKDDVLHGLRAAARATNKDRYDKGKDSFKILAALDPAAVESAAPYAARFLDAMRAGGTPPR